MNWPRHHTGLHVLSVAHVSALSETRDLSAEGVALDDPRLATVARSASTHAEGSVLAVPPEPGIALRANIAVPSVPRRSIQPAYLCPLHESLPP